MYTIKGKKRAKGQARECSKEKREKDGPHPRDIADVLRNNSENFLLFPLLIAVSRTNVGKRKEKREISPIEQT